MTSRDERLAAKYAAKGKESASDKAARKAREKQAAKSATQASGVVEELRNFSYQAGPGEKIKPVTRSADSVERAREHKRRLPGLR